MDGFAYFPTIVYRDERPDLVNQTLSSCIQHFKKTDSCDKLFNQSYHLGNDPELKEVSNYIILSAIDLLKDQGYNTSNYDFYFSGLWAQEVKKGAGTNVHLHKNSQICGWFFLETPKDGSFPIYYDTRINKSMIELDMIESTEVNFATNIINFNNIKPGSVFFANSWMQHQLSINNSDSPTRCLHFIISHRDRLCNFY